MSKASHASPSRGRSTVVEGEESVQVDHRVQGRRVVLVSNRLPVTIARQGDELEIVDSAGGLATAMGPMHAAGDGVWVGWPGELPSEPEIRRKLLRELRRRRLQPVTLSPDVVDGFYSGFSNSVLWPLLHYGAHLAVLERSWWRAYQRANQVFAAKVADVARRPTFCP